MDRTKHFQTSSYRVFPNDLNYGNTLFGGKIMAEVDCEAAKVAWSVLYGTAATNVVTKRFEIDFIAPGRQGDLIVMEADVDTLGKTSININVDVYKWDGPIRRNWTLIASAEAVFVALKDGVKFEHGQTLFEPKEGIPCCESEPIDGGICTLTEMNVGGWKPEVTPQEAYEVWMHTDNAKKFHEEMLKFVKPTHQFTVLYAEEYDEKVNELRKASGQGIMTCRRAVHANPQGTLEEHLEWLRNDIPKTGLITLHKIKE